MTVSIGVLASEPSQATALTFWRQEPVRTSC